MGWGQHSCRGAPPGRWWQAGQWSGRKLWNCRAAPILAAGSWVTPGTSRPLSGPASFLKMGPGHLREATRDSGEQTPRLAQAGLPTWAAGSLAGPVPAALPQAPRAEHPRPGPCGVRAASAPASAGLEHSRRTPAAAAPRPKAEEAWGQPGGTVRPLAAPLTPEGHEDGEEHGGRVVKEVAGAGRGAGGAHLPVAAGLVTQGAHGDVVSLVTHLHAAREGRLSSPRATGRDASWRPSGSAKALLLHHGDTVRSVSRWPLCPCPSLPPGKPHRGGTHAASPTRSRQRSRHRRLHVPQEFERGS